MAAVEDRYGTEQAGRGDADRTIAFINIAHALDHFVLLIYPTAVIAIAQQTGLAYGELIALSTGAFVAFGALSLPAGFAAKRFGRRNMLAVFFFGTAFACAGLATAGSSTAFAAWLLLLGCFAAIYHPIGPAMVVANAVHAGRALGVNGVWGNMGAALASGLTALAATWFGWRAAFLIPAATAAIVGVFYVLLVPDESKTAEASKKTPHERLPEAHRYALGAAFILAVICYGMTFNILTIALPKIIDERLGLSLPLWLTGSLATSVFIFGALTQLTVGRLIEHTPLPVLFAALALFQPLGFLLAGYSTGAPLMAGLFLAMAAIYGNVVVMDAIIARYVPDEYRTQAYGLRYFLAFAASGFAPPLIAVLHGQAGFPLVLGVTASVAAALFIAAFFVWLLLREKPVQMPEGV